MKHSASLTCSCRFLVCSDAERWKILGAPEVIGGDNLPSPGPNTKSDVFVLFRSQEIRSDIIQFSITRFGFFSSESDQKFIENGQKVPNWQKINKVFFSLDFVSEVCRTKCDCGETRIRIKGSSFANKFYSDGSILMILTWNLMLGKQVIYFTNLIYTTLPVFIVQLCLLFPSNLVQSYMYFQPQ